MAWEMPTTATTQIESLPSEQDAHTTNNSHNSNSVIALGRVGIAGKILESMGHFGGNAHHTHGVREKPGLVGISSPDKNCFVSIWHGKCPPYSLLDA